MISLYWREWLSRESALDNHLQYRSLMDGDISFSVRYLLEEKKAGTIVKPAEGGGDFCPEGTIILSRNR